MQIKEWLGLALIVIVGLILMPIIGKLLGFILMAAALFFRYVFIKSLTVKKEIEADPNEYFARQFEERQKEKVPVEGQVIDAEFKVKELENDD